MTKAIDMYHSIIVGEGSPLINAMYFSPLRTRVSDFVKHYFPLDLKNHIEHILDTLRFIGLIIFLSSEYLHSNMMHHTIIQ